MLYVITHKECEIPKQEGYAPLMVGAAGKTCKDYLRDDSGQNISKKNPDYCELTGLYWIWKNVNDEYTGIVHYRRFFSKSRWKMKIYPIEQLNEMLQSCDMIITYTEHIRFSLKKKMLVSHCSEEIFSVMRDAVAEVCPDCLGAFDRVFQKNTMCICNMMYCKKEILNNYCQWLFDVLEKTENTINSRQIAYSPRLYGFMAERLMNVWLEYKGLKCKRLPIVNTEQSLLMRLEKIAVTYVSEVLFRVRKCLHIA